MFFLINILSKKQPGGHKSLRGKGGGVHSHGQELNLNYKVNKQNNAGEVNIMIKIITMFSYDPHQRSQEVTTAALYKITIVLLP